MKAVAVFPGKADSVHLADLPEPSVDDILNGRGVLVEALHVGLDGTDAEINTRRPDNHSSASGISIAGVYPPLADLPN
jgi:hypothetical protein